jgi:hypothetical protein
MRTPQAIPVVAQARSGAARARLRRIPGVATGALVAAALVLPGCGGAPNRNAPSGTTVVQDGVAYSVQISRELNPFAADDRAVLGGLAPGTAREGRASMLLGVFLEARNDAAGPRRAAAAPQLVSASGEVFRPLSLPAGDPLAYHGGRLAPGDEIPNPESVPAETPEDGAALVYRVPIQVFITDRPFTLRFGRTPSAASVQLDV